MFLIVLFSSCVLVTQGARDQSASICDYVSCKISLVVTAILIFICICLLYEISSRKRNAEVTEVLTEDAMKEMLKTYYHHDILKGKDFTIGDSLKCHYCNDSGVVEEENYTDLLRKGEPRRLLFIGQRPVARYVLQEWTNGKILTDKIVIYIVKNDADCLLEVLVERMKVKFPTVTTDGVLTILKEQNSIVILEECNTFKMNEIDSRIESRIRFYSLMKNIFQALPKMTVWATSPPLGENDEYVFTGSVRDVRDGPMLPF